MTNFKALIDLSRRVARVSTIPAELHLRSLKKAQYAIFLALQDEFLALFADLAERDVSEFIAPVWSQLYGETSNIFLPKPPFSFLRSRLISDTMFVNAGGEWASKELKFLEENLSEKELQILLQEDYVGKPYIINCKYMTSHNSIHHLYHIIKFQNEIETELENADAIVEWGGGYGNLAKIFKRINSHATYTIIDLPIFSCVQWLYLSTVLGVNNINILTNSTDEIKLGKINLLPVCFVPEKKSWSAQTDIFIATWSLSESSTFAQDYVDSVDFFNAKHLLAAFRESSEEIPDSFRLRDIAVKHGAKVEPISFLPGNYYAFY